MYCPVILLRRVRWPIAGWPHGVLGGMPVGDLPSPPPCGWSRGVIATPRVCGRRPMWRAAAGLADALVLVIEVADLADRRHAAHVDPSNLADGMRTWASLPSLASSCAAVPALNGRSGRRGRGRARCCGWWCRAGCSCSGSALPTRASRPVAGDDDVADAEPVGHEHVALLAVAVVEQADARRAVRVVLDSSRGAPARPACRA